MVLDYVQRASGKQISAKKRKLGWTDYASRVFHYAMSVEIEIDLAKVMESLPEPVRATLREEALRRRVPLQVVIREALLRMAQEIKQAA